VSGRYREKTPVAKSHRQNIWEQCRRHALRLGEVYPPCAPERARRKQGTRMVTLSRKEMLFSSKPAATFPCFLRARSGAHRWIYFGERSAWRDTAPRYLPYDSSRPALFPITAGHSPTMRSIVHARSHEWQSQRDNVGPQRFVTRFPYVDTSSRRVTKLPHKTTQRKSNVKPNAKEKTNMKDQNYAATKTREIRLAKRSPEYWQSRVSATQHLRPRNASTSERDHHAIETDEQFKWCL